MGKKKGACSLPSQGVSDVNSLCSALGYRFQQADRLRQALTHARLNIDSLKNNERLEFLGDAILNFVISQKLHITYPNSNEGELSRLRSYLVRGRTLIELAKKLQLERYLQLSYSEQKTLERSAILENAMEAIFAAIYLDGGLDAASRVIHQLYASYFESNFEQVATAADPKTILQEYCQAHRTPLPNYEVIDVLGKPPKQTFVLSCRLEQSSQPTQGTGVTKRSAQQMAAEKMLHQLKLPTRQGKHAYD